MTTVEKEIVGSPAVQAPVSNPAVTTRDVLHRAADVLEEWDWTRGCKGMPTEGDHVPGHYCIAGAILRAHKDLTGSWPKFTYSYADKLLGIGYRVGKYAWEWNDAPGRTKAEVVARLREAAEASHE